MAKTPISLRLPEEMVSALQESGKSFTATIESSLGRLQKIRMVSADEIKGVFSSDEWKFMADCFAGTAIDDLFCTNKLVLLASVEDHARLNGGDERWNVDMDSFKQRIENLTGAQVESVFWRLEVFWAKDDNDLNSWAIW